MNIDFGDRMKLLESQEAARRFLPLLPICVRVDGKCFHNYTVNMNRPYDEGLSSLMRSVTLKLVEVTNACIGYAQSDEISLILYSDSYASDVFFNGKIQKIVSVIASMTTGFFNDMRQQFLVAMQCPPGMALFDCRAWTVPNQTEAVNTLIWREQDATRNSISMAAQSMFSHKQLHGKSCSEMQEMMFTIKNVNWNDYPIYFKRGSYFQRRKTIRKFTTDELEKLPEKHEARKNPNLEIERTDVRWIQDMPILSTIRNRIEVVFDGADPVCGSLGVYP